MQHRFLDPCFNPGETLTGLGRGDADFVVVIHSNSGGLGKRDPLGKFCYTKLQIIQFFHLTMVRIGNYLYVNAHVCLLFAKLICVSYSIHNN